MYKPCILLLVNLVLFALNVTSGEESEKPDSRNKEDSPVQSAMLYPEAFDRNIRRLYSSKIKAERKKILKAYDSALAKRLLRDEKSVIRFFMLTEVINKKGDLEKENIDLLFEEGRFKDWERCYLIDQILSLKVSPSLTEHMLEMFYENFPVDERSRKFQIAATNLLETLLYLKYDNDNTGKAPTREPGSDNSSGELKWADPGTGDL